MTATPAPEDPDRAEPGLGRVQAEPGLGRVRAEPSVGRVRAWAGSGRRSWAGVRHQPTLRALPAVG
ncbi:hypothetical protein Athai_36120 [Actinocatenispora thailandica]|uniref:Uncharacterized protein n=1 Tax=Actinocatenispora thailandica TaxID=227318 RepID=A0A7R7HYD2_9ACTN|nr:hypothetical protein [Actinocatenispora thailandica]BCJ36109.1 hypothetical protein Athai_36120 [Actinocatenispora thailandica]